MENPIRKYRENLGIRQLELALLMGVSEMTISHWERGARIPSQDTSRELARILKADLGILNQDLGKYCRWRKKELGKQLKYKRT